MSNEENKASKTNSFQNQFHYFNQRFHNSWTLTSRINKKFFFFLTVRYEENKSLYPKVEFSLVVQVGHLRFLECQQIYCMFSRADSRLMRIRPWWLSISGTHDKRLSALSSGLESSAPSVSPLSLIEESFINYKVLSLCGSTKPNESAIVYYVIESIGL